MTALTPKKVHTPRTEKREQDRRNAIQYVIGDERGRHFIHMMMDECGLNEDAWRGNSETTLVAVGRQQVGHFIRAFVSYVNAAVLGQIETEHHNRERLYAELNAAIQENSDNE